MIELGRQSPSNPTSLKGDSADAEGFARWRMEAGWWRGCCKARAW